MLIIITITSLILGLPLCYTQVPGAEDQTALSLEECLRLLEATFPFGDNSEVSECGDVLSSSWIP